MVTIKMMQDYRVQIVKRLNWRLVWHRIELSDGGSVCVCSPAAIEMKVPFSSSNQSTAPTLPDWAWDCFAEKEAVPQKVWVYLPFTKDEQWALAKKYNAFPLTTAVADQAHLHSKAHRVTYAPWPGSKLQVKAAGGPNRKTFWSYNFIGYGQILTNNKYRRLAHTKLVSGAHKLWILHNNKAAKRINYGFYQTGNAPGLGNYLSKTAKWSTQQKPGAAHGQEASFWDYSQLLQLMRNYVDPDGFPGNLYHAIQDEKLALWDTTWGKITQKDLDDLGLTEKQGEWKK